MQNIHLIVANLLTEAIGLKMRFEIYLFILNVWRCEIGNYYTVSAGENPVETTPFEVSWNTLTAFTPSLETLELSFVRCNTICSWIC